MLTMTSKEFYETPIADEIRAMEAFSILTASDMTTDDGIEDPYIDDDWEI